MIAFRHFPVKLNIKRANKEEAGHVMRLLATFEEASGQKINVEKSSVFFSRNVEEEIRREVLGIMGFKEADQNTQYLGLPNCMGRNKAAILGYVKERVRSRIQSWDGNLLNKSGKEILLKTVTQAIPNYAMSVFLIPIEMCKEMEKMMCKFWWKSSRKKDKCIHWMSWERMCKSKMYGGLGFRQLHEFNIALLGKQCWRLITNSDSLVARIYKSRYYPQGNFLSAKIGASPSFIWRSVIAAQDLIKQGLGYRVGNGASVNIVKDPWLPDPVNPYIVTENAAIEGQTVSALMEIGEHSWDKDLIEDIFDDRDANLIVAIPINRNEVDRWFWRKDKLGVYSVKSAYTLIQENKSTHNSYGNNRFWRRLWNLKVPPKVKNFIWRACTDCLPTKDLLRMKRVNVDEYCPLCNNENESIIHALVSCSFARSCWDKLVVDSNINTQGSFLQWMLSTFDNWEVESRRMGVMLCWAVWKCRNELVWRQKGMEVKDVVALARVILSQWQDAQDRNFDRSWGFMTPNDGSEHWTLPTDNQTKVNTDAAIFQFSSCYSYAFAARNQTGDLVEARSSCKPGHISPEWAEAMGIREALSWVKEKQLTDVIVETDCLVAVQAIRGSTKMMSYFGSIIQQCRDLLLELKNKGVVLRFIKRSANSLAHTIASCSYYLADRVWGPNEAYLDFSHVLENDLKF